MKISNGTKNSPLLNGQGRNKVPSIIIKRHSSYPSRARLPGITHSFWLTNGETVIVVDPLVLVTPLGECMPDFAGGCGVHLDQNGLSGCLANGELSAEVLFSGDENTW